MKNLKITILVLLLAVTNRIFAQHEAQTIDSVVNQYVSDFKFTGTLLVSQKGKIVLEKGYGFQNTEDKIYNNVKTIYNIASLTKAFTAAVILKLQEAGRLNTKDQLSKYYPSYPHGKNITIHHLLTHTSGIFNYTSDKDFMSRDQSQPVTLEQMIAVFKDKPLDFEPGAKFSYSNSGYTMLGYIIEKITGKPYSTVLQEMIFDPLGMQQTGYGFTALKNNHKATGYQWYSKDNYRKATYVDPSIAYATGAIYSTVEDLYKWHRAWQGDFFKPQSVAMAYKKDAGNYGYGWSTDSLYGRQRISHSGNIPGFKSNINRIPADDVCVIVLSNANNADAGEMVRKIMAILYHQPIPQRIIPPVIELADSLRRQYEGDYDLNQQLKVVIAMDGKQLVLRPTAQPAVHLEAISQTVFRVKGEDVHVEFIRNKDGSVDTFFLYQNGQKIKGERTR